MSARKVGKLRKRGGFDISPLKIHVVGEGYDPDARAFRFLPPSITRAHELASGLPYYKHVCPACESRVTHRPAGRDLLSYALREHLDDVREAGAITGEKLDAIERDVIGRLLGLCDACADRLVMRGRFATRGDNAA